MVGADNACPCSQHDPEDEPIVAPLSPTYFEFDCESLAVSPKYMLLIGVAPSAQG